MRLAGNGSPDTFAKGISSRNLLWNQQKIEPGMCRQVLAALIPMRCAKLALFAILLPLSGPLFAANSAPAAQTAPLPALPPASQTPLPFVVVLDAAHGGNDSGARLAGGLLEKNITLQLAGQLQKALRSQGISVVRTRESDVSLPDLNRAQIANHAHASACLILHATATGTGVHLFTSSLPPTAGARFLPWSTAQSAWVTRSLRLEGEIDSALGRANIPATMASASLEPLDHLTCPAVAVELAPGPPGRNASVPGISDPAYQKSVVAALASAIVAWRADRGQP